MQEGQKTEVELYEHVKNKFISQLRTMSRY